MALITEKVELVGGPFDGMKVEVAPGSLAVYVAAGEERCPCCNEQCLNIGYREPGDEKVELPPEIQVYIPIEQGSCTDGELRRFEPSA